MAMTKFGDIKYMDYESWFECWYLDKKNIMRCMYSNMASDIEAGYDPLGNSIKAQRDAIATYEKSINNTLDMFTNMNDDSKIERWCYHDMLKRGAIE